MVNPVYNLWQLETERLSPRVVKAIVVAALAVLGGLALLLIARRTSGALTADLPWQSLLVTAAVLFLAITGLRFAWRRTFPEPTTWDPWVAWGASLIFILLAVSFPGSNEYSWFIWLPLVGADQWLRWKLLGEASVDREKVAAPLRLSGNELQQITRSRSADGRETVYATLRAEFRAGQRTAAVYVGFCPPLTNVPEVTIESTDGIAAELKIVQAFPHGARIDVRLAREALVPMSVVLKVVARA